MFDLFFTFLVLCITFSYTHKEVTSLKLMFSKLKDKTVFFKLFSFTCLLNKGRGEVRPSIKNEHKKIFRKHPKYIYKHIHTYILIILIIN